MIKIDCSQSEKEWLIKALENSEYGCLKLNRLKNALFIARKDVHR
jgi:hypothetical protein